MEERFWGGRSYEVCFVPFTAHISSYAEEGVYRGGRNFDFAEKREVNKYYPQYYHKMDKVCVCSLIHQIALTYLTPI